MPINLNGLIIDQILADNSGPPSPFDSDLDGTASQEDEFVSVTNTNATPLDISCWTIWSDANGTGAPTAPTDGLFHTFPPGTILAPGQTLWVINEITGTAALGFAQEASEGGIGTNILTEGNGGTGAESIAIVDTLGNYIVFNMSPNAPQITSVAGFTGTNLVGVIDGHSVFADPAAGESYQYNATTDSYGYFDAFVPCFTAGAMIKTADGETTVETLKIGDLVVTLETGLQPIIWIGTTTVDFSTGHADQHRPIEFKAGSLGPALPAAPLVVSPQHRFLMINSQGAQVLAPALGLSERNHVRIKQGVKSVTYYHIVLAEHAIVFANGIPTETFYPGDASLAGLPPRQRLGLMKHFPQDSVVPQKARPFMTVNETQSARQAALRPAMFVTGWNRLGETGLKATG